MKKIGLLCLALVLALGALGVGYASWTDEITIDGTVNTGNVDIDMLLFSGTWIYKVPGADPETVYQSGWGDAGSRPQAPADGILISYAEVTAIGLDPDMTGFDAAVVTFDNLFPCEDFSVDFLIHYNGSIPAILTADIETATGSEWLDALWNAEHIYYEVYASDVDGNYTETDLICPPQQVHFCEYYVLKVFIHLPQITDAPENPFDQSKLEGLDGSFTATITATQWNEA